MKSAMQCFLVSLLLAGSALGAAAPPDLIANVSGRTTISLNGTWKAIVDPYDTGFDYRFYENRKPRSSADLVEYDFDTSENLNVPGDWNSQKEKLFFYEGTVWYGRHFQYHKRGGIRTFVYF